MSRFGVKEVADVVFYDIMSGEPVLFLDSLKMSNLTSENETTDVTGGQSNARIMTFDYDRRASFTLQDALMRPEAFSMQAGTYMTTGANTVHERKVTIVDGESIKIDHQPEGNVFIFKSEDGYKQTDKEKVDGVEFTEAEGAYTLDTSLAGLDTTYADGEQIIVYYQYKTEDTAQTMTIRSDQFGGYYKVVGKTLVRNAETQQDEAFEIQIPRAKVGSNFEIELTPDGDPAVFDMELMVYEPTNKDDNMISMVRY